jgi:hypothetical protein
MSPASNLGWCACGLMLMAFCCERAVWLRGFAVSANLAFIGYGWLADIPPVMTLHLLLLPVNFVHLVRALRDLHGRRRTCAGHSPRGPDAGFGARPCDLEVAERCPLQSPGSFREAGQPTLVDATISGEISR